MTLSDEEREKGSMFHFPADQSRYFVSHAALRIILSTYAEVRPLELVFKRGEHGKPFIAEPQSAQAISFNLSHGREIAVVAVSVQRSLGVDVEAIRIIPESDTILEHYFRANERDFVRIRESGEKAAAFLRVWTRHEAVAKCLGLDLSTAIETLSVPLFEPWASVRFRIESPQPTAGGHGGAWLLLCDLRFDTPHVGALCCTDGPCNLIFRDFECIQHLATT